MQRAPRQNTEVAVYLRSGDGEGGYPFYSSPGVLRPGAGVALSAAEAEGQATPMKLAKERNGGPSAMKPHSPVTLSCVIRC